MVQMLPELNQLYLHLGKLFSLDVQGLKVLWQVKVSASICRLSVWSRERVGFPPRVVGVFVRVSFSCLIAVKSRSNFQIVLFHGGSIFEKFYGYCSSVWLIFIEYIYFPSITISVVFIAE